MDLLKQIFQAGVVGAGGAGFPTHKKLTESMQTLVVNAAECEPLLASDRYAMRTFADEIVQALCKIREVYPVSRVVIGTKRTYTREIHALQQAIARRGAGEDIEIFQVDSFYPAGDEQVLIYEITGETVPPGGIPLALGIVVINVTTALHIFQAMQGTPVTRRYITVTGAVRHPVIVDAPVGISAADCIAAAGGATVPRYAVIQGGPMMGAHHSMEEAEQLFMRKPDGGIVVLPEDHPLVVFSQKPLEHMVNQAKSVCIQCSLCTELCPRFLIGHQMRPHRVMRSVATDTGATDLLDSLLCCECGICELFSCPMLLSPRRMNIHVKELLREKGITTPEQRVFLEQTLPRAYRRIPQSRLIHRWEMSDYPTELDEVIPCQPERVCLALRHGIGRPAAPTVRPGAQVAAGDVIAELAFEDVGSLVHASLSGQVVDVNPQGIVIERKREER